MNRKLLLMAVAVTVTTAVHAQYVTYNHDSPKQNQVTVMETGTGALSPDLYYSVLHNKYKKSATFNASTFARLTKAESMASASSTWL